MAAAPTRPSTYAEAVDTVQRVEAVEGAEAVGAFVSAVEAAAAAKAEDRPSAQRPSPERPPAQGSPAQRPPAERSQRERSQRRREPLWRDVIGEVLRRERQTQARTLQDVADAARISMPYLSELERGRKEASSEVLAAAAKALGLSLSELVSLVQVRLGDYEQSLAAQAFSGAGSRDALCLAA